MYCKYDQKNGKGDVCSLENWSKTLLQSYRYLSTIVETIDKMVKKISIGSFTYNSKSNTNTLTQFESIIELNNRKEKLINLKVYVDMTLSKLSVKDLEVLSLGYIDGLSVEEIAETQNVSVRTIFRRRKCAIEKFSHVLGDIITHDKLYSIYSDEGWLMELYEYNFARSGNLLKILDVDNKFDEGRQIFKVLNELRKMAI